MEQPIRARRSRQRGGNRLRTASIAALIALLLAGGVAVIVAVRLVSFVSTVTGGGNPFAADPVGSVAWKLKHNERVTLLILGYGGSENDAPYLTDTMMQVTLDPASRRLVEASIPRDLYGTIDAWPPSDRHHGYADKINAAFMVGTGSNWGNKLPQFSGRDGGGRLAAATVSKYTGAQIDGYAAVDFKAFRDVVNALGGVDVCLSSPLDDYNYPDYHDHYVKGGIHFKAGCQHLDGERALELARSRKAIQPEQQTDFGRARRQQMLLSAIKKQALSVNGIVKAPFLMSALEADFKTDLSLNDLRALNDFTKELPDNAIVHVALTDQNLLDVDSCGPAYLYTLCPEDQTLRMLHLYFANTLVDRDVLAEHAPVVVGNASYNAEDLGQRITAALGPLGFKTALPVRLSPAQHTVIYDYSGGRYPKTAAWLAQFFGASVQPGPANLRQTSSGLVVVVGHDFAVRWYARSQ